jgi:hypothetical protein
MKKCGGCGVFKPIADFGTHVSGIARSECRPCRVDRNYNEVLRRKYGLNRCDYEVIVETQDGRCAVCAETLTTRQHTHVDHCHETGRVRGILCKNCNNGLGMFRDRPDILRTAAEYLERGQVAL